jgi:hypothetical protein
MVREVSVVSGIRWSEVVGQTVQVLAEGLDEPFSAEADSFAAGLLGSEHGLVDGA